MFTHDWGALNPAPDGCRYKIDDVCVLEERTRGIVGQLGEMESGSWDR